MARKVIERDDGFYCVVNGREFGAWRSRAEALAGYEVERRRAADRAAEYERGWQDGAAGERARRNLA